MKLKIIESIINAIESEGGQFHLLIVPWELDPFIGYDFPKGININRENLVPLNTNPQACGRRVFNYIDNVIELSLSFGGKSLPLYIPTKSVFGINVLGDGEGTGVIHLSELKCIEEDEIKDDKPKKPKLTLV